MATQRRDGSWTETKPFDAALGEFLNEAAMGHARMFVCGTRSEVENAKAAEKNDLANQVSVLQEKVKRLEARQDDTSPIVRPTPKQIQEFTS